MSNMTESRLGLNYGGSDNFELFLKTFSGESNFAPLVSNNHWRTMWTQGTSLVDNPDPSLRKQEGATTIPKGSRLEAQSKCIAPLVGDDMVWSIRWLIAAFGRYIISDYVRTYWRSWQRLKNATSWCLSTPLELLLAVNRLNSHWLVQQLLATTLLGMRS